MEPFTVMITLSTLFLIASNSEARGTFKEKPEREPIPFKCTSWESAPPDSSNTRTTATTTSRSHVQYIFTYLTIRCKGKAAEGVPFHILSTLELYLAPSSSDSGAAGTIFFPNSNSSNISFSLRQGEGQFLAISPSLLPKANQVDIYLNSTVVVEADSELVAVAHVLCTGLSRATAFRIKAVHDLGLDYYVITRVFVGSSRVGIVAVEDNTSVTIDFSTNKGHSTTNSVQFLTLNMGRYDAYCFGGNYDTTGTYISANKPIYVLSGTFSEKLDESSSGRDPFYESLTPTNTWGSHYSIVPLNVGNPCFVRILSSMDNTMVSISVSNQNVTQNCSLDRGESQDALLFGDTNEIMEIVSTKPVLVAQFTSKSNAYEWTDPSMVLAPSHLQNIKKDIMFPVFKFPSDEPLLSYVIVWCNGDTSELSLDYSPHTNWTVIGVDSFGSVIVGLRAFLPPGSHVLHTKTNIRAVVNVGKRFMSYSFPLP